jgi:hypothetical protein
LRPARRTVGGFTSLAVDRNGVESRRSLARPSACQPSGFGAHQPGGRQPKGRKVAKQDLVLGAVGGLPWDQIEVWAQSLANSGFAGMGAVIVYDDNAEVIENLRAIGFQVLRVELTGGIMIQRFEDFHNVIRTALDDLRYVVIADVRDVYFQSDPIAWLEANLKRPFLAVTEAILHKDERWNRANAEASFPGLAHRLMDRSVYCAGVMAGEAAVVADLMLAIGLVSKATPIKTADQAAYNLLLDMEPYKSACQFTRSEDGFACQVDVLANPAKYDELGPHILEPRPVFGPDGMRTAGGKLYSIVHQYDRVPEYHAAYRAMLGRKLTGAAA